jgi:hypothetical protein
MNITFFYPSRRVGGVQLLFIRLARCLSGFEGVKVSVVDYTDGFLREALKEDAHIRMLAFEGGKVLVDFKTVLVTPLTNITECEKFLQKGSAEVSFFFWAVHPKNLYHALYEKGRGLFRWNRKAVRHAIRELSDQGIILYMDRINYQAVQEEVKEPFDPVYLPIPVPLPSNPGRKQEVVRAGVINIGWLGRIADDKVFAIIDIADQVKRLTADTDRKIRFHIIGDGEMLPLLVKHLEATGIDYIHLGTLMGSALDEYIARHIDLGVAMGTSTLEFAARHLPVVLLDYSYEKFPGEMRYHWLFETVGYSLGSKVDEYAQERKHTFDQIVRQYEEDSEYIANQCFDYVKSHHDIKYVAKELYKLASKQNGKKEGKEKLHYINKEANPFLYVLGYSVYSRVKGVIGSIRNKNTMPG